MDKKIQMMLAGDCEENDEKIQAFRAAQLHTRQAQKFHEKANSLQELLNLQSLHANVHIMPAYFTLLQEIDKLLGNAKEEVAMIYLYFPVQQLYDPPLPSHMFQTHLNFSVEEGMILFYRSFIYNITLAQMNLTTYQQQDLKSIISTLQEKLADEQMELAAFEKVNGPLSVQLHEVLKKMNVKRQAYHGKSFIGNHVHTCCKVTQILPLEQEFVESQNFIELLHLFFWQEDNIIKLCSAVLTKTEELCPSLLSQAREISVKFEQVFKLFAACHFVYDSADYLNDGKIDKLGN